MTDSSPSIPQLDTIRSAARQIRNRAAAVPPEPWRATPKYGAVAAPTATHPEVEGYGGYVIGESMPEPVREHVITWTPAVVNAVADLLETFAEQYEYETVYDETLECPGCMHTGDCGGHADNVHNVCEQVVSVCACLKPMLSVAQALLDSQVAAS